MAKKSWTIRVPFQPKDSGKFFWGSFNVLGLEFSDRLPRRLNNFLWWIRGLPGIHIISVFLARGGIRKCYRCTKFMYPWQVLIEDGNVYNRYFPMDTHTKCELSLKSNMALVQFIEDHCIKTFYQPDWFIASTLEDYWKKITERSTEERIKKRMEDFPLHKLVKEKIDYGRMEKT